MSKTFKKICGFVLICMCFLTLMMVQVNAKSFSAGHIDADTMIPEYNAYPFAECNRIIRVKLQTEDGSLIKRVIIHTRHGADDTFNLNVGGYDIVGFSSDQGVWETCKMQSSSGCGTGIESYLSVHYYFRTSLSHPDLNITVTLRPWDAIQFEVRHYVQDAPLNNFHRNNYTLHSVTDRKSIAYKEHFQVDAKAIPGYTIHTGYRSTVSGNLCFVHMAGRIPNTPSSPRCYSYDYLGNNELKNREYSTYDEKKDGKLATCGNRKFWVEFFYDRESYTIQFNGNGGSAPAGQTKYYGIDMNLPTEIPVRPGYTFRGWGTSAMDRTPDYQPGGRYIANADRTLYAIWRRTPVPNYVITYNANGGYGEPTNQRKPHDRPIELSRNKPTRTGYTFLGWSLSSTATSPTYKPGDRYTANQSATFYAVWEKRKVYYTITYLPNGGYGGPTYQACEQGQMITLSSSQPKRSDHTFMGWSTDPGAGYVLYYAGGRYMFNANTQLYAVWKRDVPLTYTVHFEANGGKNPPADMIKTAGVPMYLPTEVPSRSQYTFVGWSANAASTTATYRAGQLYNGDGDATLYAVWIYTPETYTILFDANGGTNAPATISKVYGVDLMLPDQVPSRSHFRFIGWSEDPLAIVPTYSPGGIYNLNQSVTLYAVWEPDQYDFSVSDITLSLDAPYRYDTIQVTTILSNHDTKRAYTDIPVEIWYNGAKLSTQLVSFQKEGTVRLTFNLQVGDSAGDWLLEVRLNWAARSLEVSSMDNSKSVLVHVKDFEFDLTARPILPGTAYIVGTDVISSFYVDNNSDWDILPNQHNTVAFEVYYYAGSRKVTVFTDRQDDVVIPRHGTNLVYFRWRVPDVVGTIYCSIVVNSDDTVIEPNRVNNQVCFENSVILQENSQTSNTRYENQIPSSYHDTAIPPIQQGRATWTEWQYNGHEFVLKKFGLQLNYANPMVTPSSDCSTAQKINGKWQIGSGYGFKIAYKPAFGSVNGYEMPEGKYTGIQSVSAYFPEMNYGTSFGQYRTMVSADGQYQFIQNADANRSDRIHFIPVWYPDGEYVVSVTATQIWTPVGMMTATRNSNPIVIHGTMYDDFYVGN